MQIGSLVELIDDIWAIQRSFCKYPVKKVIYEVRTYEETLDGPALTLEEIINPLVIYRSGIHELRFGAHKFREIQPPLDVQALIEECMFETA